MKLFKLIVFSLIIIFSSSSYAKRSFIIDTDVASDDQASILYLLKRPDVEIKAITIASTGEAHCKPALQNVFSLLELTHKTSIPFACGREMPLAGMHRFPDWLRHEADITMPIQGKIPKQNQSAMDLLINTLSKSSPHSVDILAIGPLTNIAEAMKKNPAIKNKIRMIYIMGGAVHVKGNILDVDKSVDNKLAEWNIYIDPVAADIVFRSGVPITLVPLDISNQVPFDYNFYQLLKKHRNNPAVNYMYALYHRNEKQIKEHRWYFWDVLAAVIASDEKITTMENKKLKIVLAPESEAGATVIDDKQGTKVRVCVKPNEVQFKKILMKAIDS